ncbi:MAG: PH domain-containing protein [Candidatus Uhrbacteria bacterium]
MSFTDRLNLHDGERVVAVVRRSMLAYFWPAAGGAAVIVLAFLLVVPLLSSGKIGLIAFCAAVLVGALLAARAAWSWYRTALVATNERVIDVDQRGLFHRGVAEARFDRVEDVSVTIRGVIATLFHLGTIRIVTIGTTASIELHTIAHPELARELLSQLVAEARSRASAVLRGDIDLTRLDRDALLRLRERVDVELRLRTGPPAR